MILEISPVGLDEMSKRLKAVDWYNTKAQLIKSAEMVKNAWYLKASNPKEKHARWFSTRYARSLSVIDRRMSPSTGNFFVTVGPKGRKGLESANIVENGRERYNMKPALLNSSKSRMGKNGRYTIIGFKHGMKQVRQYGMTDEFKQLKVYAKTGQYKGLNGFRQKVERNIYSYSSQGMGKNIKSQGKPLKKHHKSPVMSGLTKTKQQTKGADQFQAVTFRIVSAKSDSNSWYYPQIKGQKIMQEVYNKNKKLTENAIYEAIGLDLKRTIEGLKLNKRGDK